jgi:hypothetical protein
MAKRKNNNFNGSDSLRIRHFFKKEVLIAVVFALIFGGVGGYLVKGSHAEGAGCVTETFKNNSYFINTYEPCVNDAQGMLNSMHYASGVTPLISTDGYFGPQTEGAVRDFQNAFMERSEVTGVMNPVTWNSLCSYDNIVKDGHPGVSYHGADCQSL